MDLWWILVVAFLVATYFLTLVGYRLWLSIKSLMEVVTKTNQLLSELKALDENVLEPATPARAEDLEKLLSKRRKILQNRRKRQVDRQRRLVNRVREIDIDKRWA